MNRAVISGLIANVLANLEPPPLLYSTTRNSAFKIGDKVLHKPPNPKLQNYGVGVVKRQWGCFFTCRECFRELGVDQTTCPHCRKETLLLSVNGREIFDVRFGKEIKPRAINQCWLKKI